MKTKYYILTRLNSISFTDRPHLMKDNLNDEWLQARMKLFKEYCVPSIENQSFQDFEHIVYCHPASPEWFTDELYSIDSITVSFEYKYASALDRSADILVTSRLDSDDLYHRDYMLGISEYLDEFKENRFKREVYSFATGYHYSINKGPRGTMHTAKAPTAPFLTLFADIREDKENCQVYYKMHDTLPKVVPCQYNRKQRGWMYIKHDDNIGGSGFSIQELADITGTFEQFGIKK